MSSADFSTVLVKDDRIANLTDKITYAVNKGAQQVTVAEFSATSESNSSHVYNIVVPSLETIIDRRVLWTSTVILKVTCDCKANFQVINYGLRDSLGPMPLHQLCQTITATINNNTVSCNIKDVIDPMLRMLDNRDLARYNNSTPVMYDTYAKYPDMADANNSNFGGFDLATDQFIKPRGAFALDAVANDAVFSVPMAETAGNGKSAYIKFTVTEPLLLSPFLFGNPSHNNQGMYGVQNMSFNMNMSDTKRVWRHDNGPGGNSSVITGVELVRFEKSKLTFNFLTAHPSDQLSSRCVVPYYELPRYLTTFSAPVVVCPPPLYVGGELTPTPATLSSTTISLNQIPDKLIIYVRKKDKTWTDADRFLSIKKININWNNNTGVCSSFNQVDLWRCSVEAGSNQSWDEFKGVASRQNPAAESNPGAGAGLKVPTCGSVLMLDVGQHLNLVEDYYAPGSIGQFSLQFTVTCENYGPEMIPELVLVCMNGGSFSTERGSSSTYTALLTKEDVLQASATEPVSRGEVSRLVGGGFLDSLKSAFKWLLPHAGKIANTALTVHDIYKDGPTHKSTKARHIVKALGGSSRSGGSMSGGLMARLR